MARLVLLRHAKAEGGHNDEARPLSLVGRRQCVDVAASLSAAGLTPDVVLVSSALRTRQTWQLVSGGLTFAADPRVFITPALYGAGPDEVLELVGAVPDDVRTVLVVGHEPTMSFTAALLADDASDPELVAQARLGISTAAYAVLDLPRFDAIDRGAASLTAVVRVPR